MLFFIRSTGQVCSSVSDLINVEHLIPQIEKKNHLDGILLITLMHPYLLT